MAIGSSIGTALFVGSGQVLAIRESSDHTFLLRLLSFFYCVVTAVIEVGTHLPISGSLIALLLHALSLTFLGFVLDWLYIYAFGMIVAY